MRRSMQAAGLLQGYVSESNTDASQPVVRLASPDELRAAFRAAGVPMALAQGQEPIGVDCLMGARAAAAAAAGCGRAMRLRPLPCALWQPPRRSTPAASALSPPGLARAAPATRLARLMPARQARCGKCCATRRARPTRLVRAS